MKRILLLSLIIVFAACKNNTKRTIDNISQSVSQKSVTEVADEVAVKIDPIRHASFVLTLG